MVSATTPTPIIMGGLNLKISQNFVGAKFFLNFVGWINLYGGSEGGRGGGVKIIWGE